MQSKGIELSLTSINWTIVSEQLATRSPKQCRERYVNHLDPSLKKTPFDKIEDIQLLELQSKYGNSWTLIATMMPGRSENQVKNRWNSASYRRGAKDLRGARRFRGRGKARGRGRGGVRGKLTAVGSTAGNMLSPISLSSFSSSSSSSSSSVSSSSPISMDHFRAQSSLSSYTFDKISPADSDASGLSLLVGISQGFSQPSTPVDHDKDLDMQQEDLNILASIDSTIHVERFDSWFSNMSISSCSVSGSCGGNDEWKREKDRGKESIEMMTTSATEATTTYTSTSIGSCMDIQKIERKDSLSTIDTDISEGILIHGFQWRSSSSI